MTTAKQLSDEPTSISALRILGEIPAFVSSRIAHYRAQPEGDSLTPDQLAEKVAASLNAGQRFQIAVRAIVGDVEAYDRAHVRAIEKKAVTRRIRPRRKPDPNAVAACAAEMTEVRALATQRALDMVVELSPELLDAVIRLGDGAEVRIGDATIEQHEARIDLLDRHAQGATDTLARAIALLSVLRQSGRASLREVVS